MLRILSFIIISIGIFSLGGCAKCTDLDDNGICDVNEKEPTDSTNPGGSEGILDDNLSKDYPDGIKVMSESGKYIGDLLYVSKGKDDSIIYNILKDDKYILPISYEFDSQYGVFNPIELFDGNSKKFVLGNHSADGLDVDSYHIEYFAPQSIEEKLHRIASDTGEGSLIYFFTDIDSSNYTYYTVTNTQCFDLSFSETNVGYDYGIRYSALARKQRRICASMMLQNFSSDNVVYGKTISNAKACLKAVFGSGATAVPDYGQMSFINNTDDSTIEESKLSKEYALEYN